MVYSKHFTIKNTRSVFIFLKKKSNRILFSEKENKWRLVLNSCIECWDLFLLKHFIPSFLNPKLLFFYMKQYHLFIIFKRNPHFKTVRSHLKSDRTFSLFWRDDGVRYSIKFSHIHYFQIRKSFCFFVIFFISLSLLSASVFVSNSSL